jgi:hypothetical protein
MCSLGDGSFLGSLGGMRRNNCIGVLSNVQTSSMQLDSEDGAVR